MLHAVNNYPDPKEFRDGDKMWRSDCESERKQQRKDRIAMQLKKNGETLDDEFDKFFDEGIKRCDLVKESCLDRRIWEWQINLNYIQKIRNSPFFNTKNNKNKNKNKK